MRRRLDPTAAACQADRCRAVRLCLPQVTAALLAAAALRTAKRSVAGRQTERGRWRLLQRRRQRGSSTAHACSIGWQLRYVVERQRVHSQLQPANVPTRMQPRLQTASPCENCSDMSLGFAAAPPER